MAHPIAPFARAAYTAGWARSGAPSGPRFHAGLDAAERLAAEHADDPHVLEVTVDLGRLEGMWAVLYQRRTALQAKHARSVAAALTALLTPERIAATVRDLRHALGLTETERDRRRETTEVATAAVLAMLQALAHEAGWHDVRQTLRDALAAGAADGMVAAVAIAAREADAAGLDWDAAFQDAYADVQRLDDLWGAADTWLGRLLARAAADLGRVLSGLAADEADAEDMANAAADYLGNLGAADFTVDWAMTDAAASGALALYQTDGAASVSVITVGDGRVCPACYDAEAGSPWHLLEAPRLPLHPMCRCTYAADIDLAHFAHWFT